MHRRQSATCKLAYRVQIILYIRDCFIYPIDRFTGKTEIGFCMLSIDCVLTLQYIYMLHVFICIYNCMT